jgi:heterodisulfide reductase subunit C
MSNNLTPYINPELPPDDCPNCGANLYYLPIPFEHREYYTRPFFFSRRIGLYDVKADRTVSWKCPDCGHTWERT